ncbi:GDYXXLXY domain-containing protein [Deinococcus lacus]|uniref:GDYXXLXY domain-containing protein n=1 Tax=Deinococcus lacus TaxID=392561 RepID=A0ABW1YCP3_9DEIO
MTRRPPGTWSACAKALSAAAGLQLLLALGLVTPALLSNLNAQEILLQTQPVDPRDPLRGHYLTLNYSVNTVKTDLNLSSGQTVYLPLQEAGGGTWQAGGPLGTVPPDSGLFLRGKVLYSSGRSAQVNYGIERFYLEETAALEQERLNWDGNAQPLKAYIAVAPDGRARVVGLRRGAWEVR